MPRRHEILRICFYSKLAPQYRGASDAEARKDPSTSSSLSVSPAKPAQLQSKRPEPDPHLWPFRAPREEMNREERTFSFDTNLVLAVSGIGPE
jgi:hypothetical protein